MKLTTILLTVMALQVSARGYSQTLTLNLHDATLEKVFREIQKQTGYAFFYERGVVQNADKVSILVKGGSMDQVLKEAFGKQPLDYSIIDKTIVVKEKPSVLTVERKIAIPPPPVPIHGVVTDDNGAPVMGVSVVVKGTQKGTTTNSSGAFSIDAERGDVLEFSIVGYKNVSVTVGSNPNINVTLQMEATMGNDVVVVGYGTQNKKDLVGSVGVASRKDFGDVSVSNTSQLIQGKIAGVQVVNNTGEPGSGTQIVVRGTGSFTNVSPLYVIDGIQSDQSTFNAISPFDIQEVTVLKDASSVAIYGAQGANGVVIVTTRRPKNGAPRVTYDGYVGYSVPWKQFDILDAAQYTAFVKDWYQNAGLVLPPRVASPQALITLTDWQDEMFRTGTLTEHHINVGGGSEHVNYSFSLGYTKQQGVVIGSDYQRTDARFKTEENIGKRIKVGQQLNVQYSIRKGQSANILAGLRMPPYIPVYDSTNLLGGFGIATSALDGNDSQNPLIQPSLRDVKDHRINSYLQLYAEVNVLKGLKFRSQLGGNFNFNQFYNYNPTYAGNQLVTQNQIQEYYAYGLNYVIENYFTYVKQLQKHDFNFTIGNSYRDGGLSRSVNLVGSSFANDVIHQIGVAKDQIVSGADANSNARFISYFARLNYVFDNKYILTLTGRRDATSLFSEDNRVGYFPAVGLGWRLSDETFMKNIAAISYLKLRGSWGKTGNSNINGFSYQSNVWTGSGNSVVYPLGQSEVLVNGATVAIPATPNLQWETTTTSDVGLDASFLNGRLSVSAEYYNRNNKNLLVNVPLALSTGYGGVSGATSSQLINAASAYNRGVEVSIGYNNQAADLTYSISVNGSYNKNEVTSLGTQDAAPIINGSFFDVSSMTRTEPGHPIGAFYGYVYDHVAIDAADVEKYNEMARKITGDPTAEYQAGLMPGDRIYQDVNGDGKISEGDKTYLGSPIPKWNYGANINLGYKNFDFMVALQGVAGVQIINAMKFYTEGMPLPFNGKSAILNRWKNPGDITDIARAGQNFSTSANLRPSSWYVEDGSYARLRNVTVGYTINEPFSQVVTNFISNVRFYVTAQNLLTFTNYSGYDPEIGTGNIIFSRGIDLGAVPQARSFIVGVQVGF